MQLQNSPPRFDLISNTFKLTRVGMWDKNPIKSVSLTIPSEFIRENAVEFASHHHFLKKESAIWVHERPVNKQFVSPQCWFVLWKEKCEYLLFHSIT